MASPSGISGESCNLAIRSSPRPFRSAIRVAELSEESVEMKEGDRERKKTAGHTRGRECGLQRAWHWMQQRTLLRPEVSSI